MKHLITGGSGFIGNLVGRRLLDRGEKVRILDVWEDPSRPPDIEFVRGSVLYRTSVAEALNGIDVVHHNAALVAQTDAGAMYWKVNVEGARVVAEEAAKAGIQAFIHTSSTAVFGIPDDGPITNETSLRPFEPYGRSKLAGEQVVEKICQQNRVPLITIRPRATLGPGRLGIFQILFQWIKENRKVYVIGSGNVKFQFVHAFDLMDFYMLALDVGKTGTYNVGTDRFGTLRGDLQFLIASVGSKSKVQGLPVLLAINCLRILYRVRLSPLVPWHYLTYHKPCFFDVKPLLDMGWKPRYSNIEMFEESYKWFLSNSMSSLWKQESAHRKPLKQGILEILRRIS